MIMFEIGTLAEKLVKKITIKMDMNRINGIGQDCRACKVYPSIFDIPELSLAVDSANPPPAIE